MEEKENKQIYVQLPHKKVKLVKIEDFFNKIYSDEEQKEIIKQINS